MKRTKYAKKEPRFKVGQVVMVDTAWYAMDHKKVERYQKIKTIWPWPEYKPQPYGYTLDNGDSANEKWLRALTKREAGQ